MGAVFLQHADGTDAALTYPTVHLQVKASQRRRTSRSPPHNPPNLQQAPVDRACPTFEGLARVHQRVFGVEGGGPMRLLVLAAVRGRTGEAGAGGGPLHPRAHVTPHHLLRRREGGVCLLRVGVAGPGGRGRQPRGAIASLFVFVSDQSENFIDAELRTLVKVVFTQRTGRGGARCPVASNTRLGRDTQL